MGIPHNRSRQPGSKGSGSTAFRPVTVAAPAPLRQTASAGTCPCPGRETGSNGCRAVISIHDFNDFIQDQFAVFGYLEDHPEFRDVEKPYLAEDGKVHLEIHGEGWSCLVEHANLEFTHQETRRTVRIPRTQLSPFEFTVKGLLTYLLSKYEDCELNDIIVENWIVRQIPQGRVRRSDHSEHCFTIL